MVRGPLTNGLLMNIVYILQYYGRFLLFAAWQNRHDAVVDVSGQHSESLSLPALNLFEAALGSPTFQLLSMSVASAHPELPSRLMWCSFHPWGGPAYSKGEKVFSVSPTMGPLDYSLAELVLACHLAIGAQPADLSWPGVLSAAATATTSEVLHMSPKSAKDATQVQPTEAAQRHIEELVRRGQTSNNPNIAQTKSEPRVFLCRL